jgi:DNA-directed RNA polymerase I and III subunit RPAC1
MDFFQRAPEGQPATGATNRNAVVLKLAVECTRNQDAKKGEDDPTKLFNGAHVYAKDIEWVKQAGQDKMFPEPDGGIGVTNPDILLAKMRPGQVIDLDMWAILGYGADHAKFSPVATASYRLLPSIEIVKPILGDDAKKFARCFPRGVIGLEDVTKEEAAKNGSGYEGHQGDKKAVVRDVFSDTVSRECLRHEEFHGKVKLGRKRDHFIFSIESTGQFESDDLFLESIMVLKQKCQHFKRALDEMIR